MPIDIKKGFDDQDYLWDIRRNLLNPVTVKVATLEDKMSVVEPIAKSAYTHLDVLTDEKKIVLFSENGESDINLTGMFREGSDLSVQGESGPSTQNVTTLKLKDGSVARGATGFAEVSYDWAKIVGDNQKDLQVGTIADGTKATKHLFFRGANKVVHTDGDVTTIDITSAENQILASIPSKAEYQTPVPVTHIQLEGDVDSSNIVGSKLIINMNDNSGGVAPVASDNFKGFFESFGDLEDEVKDPKNGKSYAFVKDTQLGGKYYTPHFYIANGWKEFKQDPALTYSGPTDPVTHGVFSIKPSERIIVDDNGQLNLDGLSTPTSPKYFHGFFENIAELRSEVTSPITNKSFAYVKHANGAWIGVQWRVFGTGLDWKVMAPIGALSMVDSKTSTTIPAPFYGVYRNDQWELDSNGLATLKQVNTKTKVQIVDSAGDVKTGEFDTIQFRSGKSYVNINNEKLFIDHPQQIIQYDSEFESVHNSRDYEGNIFYDENSRTWMGWGVPAAAGGVDKKWTRIAHPKMSDEVKDLTKRLPAKSPSVTPGILNDANEWRYNGVTYLEKDNENLPDDIKDKYGAYITTSIQDKDAVGVTIPQYRIQTLTVDSDEGGTYVRRWVANGSPGAAVDWSKWVCTSFSRADIIRHENDPNAHRHVIKCYRATTFTAKYLDFYNQSTGGSPGGIRAENCSTIADNYGYLNVDQDFIEPPYDNTFRVRGVFALSGYNEKKSTYPLGAWKVLIRIKRKATNEWRQISHFIYTHVDDKIKYPLLSFETNDIELVRGDQIIINVTFDNNGGIKNNHPDLYFVPIRSYLVLEDKNTRAGSRIAKTFSKYVGTVDAVGDVGVRVHHSDPSKPTSSIRVYGENVSHTPTEMKPIP